MSQITHGQITYQDPRNFVFQTLPIGDQESKYFEGKLGIDSVFCNAFCFWSRQRDQEGAESACGLHGCPSGPIAPDYFRNENQVGRFAQAVPWTIVLMQPVAEFLPVYLVGKRILQC